MFYAKEILVIVSQGYFTFIQCLANVEDIGLMLYKCYANILCLLGWLTINKNAKALLLFALLLVNRLCQVKSKPCTFCFPGTDVEISVDPDNDSDEIEIQSAERNEAQNEHTDSNTAKRRMYFHIKMI